MIYQSLGLLAVLAFLYAASSKWIERTPINGALLFTLFGMLFGSAGLDLFHIPVDAQGLQLIAELTLAIVLFSDAASVDFSVLIRNLRLPERLLFIGLPLTILLGFAAGALIFEELPLVELAILAVMLAPTDAALGKAVISDTRVEPSIRTGLNVESGLNDGVCVPVLFAFLALTMYEGPEHGIVGFLFREIGIGLAVGLVVSYCCAHIWHAASGRQLVEGTWGHLVVASIALMCFIGAQLLGGSGFIAAFSGGLLYGKLVGDHKHDLLESAEATGDLLSMATWTIFGAAVIGPTIGAFSLDVLLYSLLSLTVVRMVPVYLSLSGSAFTTSEKLFIGWFGPRGLASIVFAVIVVGRDLPGEDTLIMTVVCTVMLSVLLHGLTANPWVNHLANNRNSR